MSDRASIPAASSSPSVALAAVIVLDLQTAMFDGTLLPPIHQAAALVQRVWAVTDWARCRGHKVAFVRHDGAPGEALAVGSPGWPVWPALSQASGEPTFSESTNNAFNPELENWVSRLGAGEVILLGAQTDRCVANTVMGALQRGLRVTVISDAHSTWDAADEPAGQIIKRYNTIFETAGAHVTTADSLTSA